MLILRGWQVRSLAMSVAANFIGIATDLVGGSCRAFASVFTFPFLPVSFFLVNIIASDYQQHHFEIQYLLSALHTFFTRRFLEHTDRSGTLNLSTSINMDKLWTNAMTWNETVVKGATLLAERGYNVTIQDMAAVHIENWVNTVLFCWRGLFTQTHGSNPEKSLQTMLLTSFLLTLVGYFGQLWNRSPMDPPARAKFERMPMAFESMCLIGFALYRYGLTQSDEQKKKLRALLAYHTACAAFFAIRSFYMTSNLIDAIDRAIMITKGHQVSHFDELM